MQLIATNPSFPPADFGSAEDLLKLPAVLAAEDECPGDCYYLALHDTNELVRQRNVDPFNRFSVGRILGEIDEIVALGFPASRLLVKVGWKARAMKSSGVETNTARAIHRHVLKAQITVGPLPDDDLREYLQQHYPSIAMMEIIGVGVAIYDNEQRTVAQAPPGFNLVVLTNRDRRRFIALAPLGYSEKPEV